MSSTQSSQGKYATISSLTDSSFGIPTDVTFQIMGFENGKEKEVLLGEVTGHKIILGMLSSVFKRGFFGPAKETKDIVPVKETTLEAFQKMLDYIYNKDIDWSAMTVLELYDVVNLAEKYDIPGMLDEVKTQMENVPPNMDDVMDVANTAAQFTQFPTVSNQLLLNCTKIMMKNLKTPASLLQFAMDQSGTGHEATVLKLMVLIKAQNKDQPVCVNCKQVECQDGKFLSRLDEFYPGLNLTMNTKSFYCATFAGDHSVVTVNQSNASVTTRIAPGTTGNAGTFFIVDKSAVPVPTFCYKCK